MASVYDIHGNEKIDALICRIQALGSVAVAFSSGVDSTFLLKVAHDVLGDGCVAVTAVSPAFPREEKESAAAFCAENHITQIVFPSGEIDLEEYASNPNNRCYYCKRHLFQKIQTIAAERHLSAVIEGSNLDDLGDYRPGLQALAELGIVSPLQESGFTKAEIRELSHILGLPTWDRPSFACLASRVPYGERISREKLAMIEQAERYLSQLGFRQYRVRAHGMLARIEIELPQMPLLMKHRECVLESFQRIGFTYVTLDLQGFRTGSMNEVLAAEERISHGRT